MKRIKREELKDYIRSPYTRRRIYETIGEAETYMISGIFEYYHESGRMLPIESVSDDCEIVYHDTARLLLSDGYGNDIYLLLIKE